jgi:hypothetical protein
VKDADDGHVEAAGRERGCGERSGDRVEKDGARASLL